jgi:hypothetical protein
MGSIKTCICPHPKPHVAQPVTLRLLVAHCGVFSRGGPEAGEVGVCRGDGAPGGRH